MRSRFWGSSSMANSFRDLGSLIGRSELGDDLIAKSLLRAERDRQERRGSSLGTEPISPGGSLTRCAIKAGTSGEQGPVQARCEHCAPSPRYENPRPKQVDKPVPSCLLATATGANYVGGSRC